MTFLFVRQVQPCGRWLRRRSRWCCSRTPRAWICGRCDARLLCRCGCLAWACRSRLSSADWSRCFGGPGISCPETAPLPGARRPEDHGVGSGAGLYRGRPDDDPEAGGAAGGAGRPLTQQPAAPAGAQSITRTAGRQADRLASRSFAGSRAAGPPREHQATVCSNNCVTPGGPTLLFRTLRTSKTDTLPSPRKVSINLVDRLSSVRPISHHQVAPRSEAGEPEISRRS